MLKAVAAVAFLWTQAALPADGPDRRVAEWVLYMGGNVRVAGDPRTIQDPSQLPAGDFHLESVDLSAPIASTRLTWRNSVLCGI